MDQFPRRGVEPSVCGRRAEKWSGGRRGAHSESQPERNGAAAEPQTEGRRSCGPREIVARDERAVCEAERVWSRGRRGRPTVPWSVEKPRVGHGGVRLRPFYGPLGTIVCTHVGNRDYQSHKVE